jgi:Secretion system C-terminal sorting domain
VFHLNGETMMKIIIVLLLISLSITFSQSVYNIEPGTKGNQIRLTVSNISDLNQAEGVEVKLVKGSSFLSFTNEIEIIELLEPKEETEAIFLFDIKRSAPVNQRDTVEIMISDHAYRQAGVNGMMIMKSFVFNYTGPKEFKLEQNYPNPFNPTTKIQYQIPELGARRAVSVQLKVYDILGSEIATLINKEQEPGYYEVQFNGGSIASGMYIYRLTSDKYSSIKKMMLMK